MRSKWIFAIILGFLALFILFQNDHKVTLQFLFWQINLSRFLLLITAFFCGWVLGFVMGRQPKKRRFL